MFEPAALFNFYLWLIATKHFVTTLQSLNMKLPEQLQPNNVERAKLTNTGHHWRCILCLNQYNMAQYYLFITICFNQSSLDLAVRSSSWCSWRRRGQVHVLSGWLPLLTPLGLKVSKQLLHLNNAKCCHEKPGIAEGAATYR